MKIFNLILMIENDAKLRKIAIIIASIGVFSLLFATPVLMDVLLKYPKQNSHKLWNKLEIVTEHPEINKKELAQNLDISVSGKAYLFNLLPFYRKLNILEVVDVSEISEATYDIELCNERAGFPGETTVYIRLSFNNLEPTKFSGKLKIVNRTVKPDLNTVTRRNDFGGEYCDNKGSFYQTHADVSFSGTININKSTQNYIINLVVKDRDGVEAKLFSIEKKNNKIKLLRR